MSPNQRKQAARVSSNKTTWRARVIMKTAKTALSKLWFSHLRGALGGQRKVAFPNRRRRRRLGPCKPTVKTLPPHRLFGAWKFQREGKIGRSTGACKLGSHILIKLKSFSKLVGKCLKACLPRVSENFVCLICMWGGEGFFAWATLLRNRVRVSLALDER